MTQVKMPEPVAFRSKDTPYLFGLGGPETAGFDGLITTEQAEAYAKARVREALEYAATVVWELRSKPKVEGRIVADSEGGNMTEIKLPPPHGYIYVWDGPYGTHRLTAGQYNGRQCDRAVAYYTEAQVHAAIEADRKHFAETLSALSGDAAGMYEQECDSYFNGLSDGYDYAAQVLRVEEKSAERKRGGEPVERPDEYAYFSDWYGKDAPDESEVSAHHMARHAWLSGIRFADLFPDAPQPAEPCATCNDNGAVGNILNAEPCQDCTPQPAEPVKVPSDAELFALHDEYFPTMVLGHDNYLSFARALLAKYGNHPTGRNPDAL